MHRYYLFDLFDSLKYMNWLNLGDDLIKIESVLLFQNHKIEKGMCLPEPKKRFGLDALRKIVKVLDGLDESTIARIDVNVMSSINNTLASYKTHINKNADEKNCIYATEVNRLIENRFRDEFAGQSDTPVQLMPKTVLEFEEYLNFVRSRKSVRNFNSSRKIEIAEIEKAIEAALETPSACNRQPWQVYVTQDMELVYKCLSFQNGNRGFEKTIGTLLTVVVDKKSYFDPTERHQPYVDGGLFSMSLIYGLHARGIQTCCLNWCATREKDVGLHGLIKLEKSKEIIMLIACGYADGGVLVPRSQRKSSNVFLKNLDL